MLYTASMMCHQYHIQTCPLCLQRVLVSLWRKVANAVLLNDVAMDSFNSCYRVILDSTRWETVFHT